MITREHLWATVMAVSDSSVTDERYTLPSHGDNAPHPPQLATAFERARTAVYRNRICATSYANQAKVRNIHLNELPKENHFVQPDDCGTAISIMLPLLHIMFRDPDARIVILPCTQTADDERTLTTEIQHALHKLKSKPGIVLLGVRPDAVIAGIDYIAMGAHDRHRLFGVQQLISAPALLDAQALVDTGALWNTSILVASASALLDLFMAKLPDIVADMQIAVIRDELSPNGPLGIRQLYKHLPHLDFAKDVLAGAENFIRVLPVPSCGWNAVNMPPDADMDRQPQQFSLRVNSR